MLKETALAGTDSEYEPDFADDIPDPENGEVQVQFEASSPKAASPAVGGEDAPQGVGSPSAKDKLVPAIDDAPAGARVPIDNLASYRCYLCCSAVGHSPADSSQTH